MALVREQVVQTAEKYVSRGKIEPAIREYRKLLAENPNDINTLNRIGDLYARINRVDEAVEFFFQIADRYTAEGFFVKAIAIYKKIIKLDPIRLDVYEKLAELYHRQGLVNEARTQYQVLADYYVKHANATSAAGIYQKMAEVEPQNPTYHVRLAEIYREQHLVEKARSEYQIIAEMMLSHDRPQEAAQVYERALDLDASDLKFIEDAVSRLRAAGNEAGAARFLAVACDRNPDAVAIARRNPPPADLDSTTARRQAALDSTAARQALDSTQARRATLDSTAARRAALDQTASRRTAPLDATAVRQAREQARRPAPEPLREELGDETVFMGTASLDFGRAVEPEMSVEQALAAASAAAGASFEEREAEPGEFEIDLDDVFVLELEDDEEPASLVKPPPDLADQPRRPAWAQPEPDAVPAPAPKQAFVAPAAAPAPAPEAESEEVEASGEVPIDFSSYFDLSPPELPEPLLGGEYELVIEEEEEPPSEPGGLLIDADLLERTASELQPRAQEREEDLVSEAEVLAKYGLEEKALDRLREAIRLRPTHLAAYSLIVQILMEKGRRPKVVEIANQMAQVALEVGDREHWPRLRKALVAAGYWVEGDRVSLAPAEPAALPTPAEPEWVAGPAEAEAEAFQVELEDELELDFDLGEMPPLAAQPPAPAPPPKQVAPQQAFDLRELGSLVEAEELEEVEEPPEIDELPEVEEPPPAEPAPPPQAPPAPRPTFDLRELGSLIDEEEPELEELEVAPPPPTAAASPSAPPAARAPAAPVAGGPSRRTGSVDQMLEGLLGDKKSKPAPAPAAPARTAPPPAASAPAPMQAAAPAPPPAAPPAAPPGLFNPLEIGEMIEAEEVQWEEPASATSAAPASLDDTGMSWLDDAERSRQGGERREVADTTFDDEDDFFDLAAELEQELSQEELFQGGDGGLMPSEQSLEEIVEGFKRGVAEHLSPTDYDTHFNLGIAYREMGLLDEAVGEFQLAAKDPGHLVLCCSMLGLCFQDKGMPELAAKWYRKGLEAPGIPDDDTLGLMYDLGNALDAAGDRDGAYKVFVDLYGIDSSYRDVVARVEELSPGR